MDNYKLDFSDPAASLALAGGKGANLCKMTQAGFPVPAGFVITTQAFELFIAQSDRQEALNSLILLATRNSNDIKSISEQIRTLIISFSMPVEVENAVRSSLTTFHEDTFYAVRSSATAEDLPYLSFAGQQDTYLNVQGLDSLLAHIRQCWASLYTERALIYRAENQIDPLAVSMAVVVQKMVFPQVSGILFTADPLSNDRNVQLINASYGLGEALVSGLVNPDLIYLIKDDDSIQSYVVAEKNVMICAVPGGGTQQLAVPESQRKEKCLDNAQIQKLGALGKKVELYYGTPQDIEWAISDGELHLLQTRPITSLFPLPEPLPQDGNLHIYLSVGHPQMNTDAFSPLGLDIISLLLPFGRPPLAADYCPYVHIAAGRMYADLNPLLNNPQGQKLLPRLLQIAEPVAARQITDFVNSSRLKLLNRKHGRRLSFSLLTDWLFPVFAGVLRLLLFARMDNLPERMQSINQASLEELSTSISAVPMPERLLLIKRKLGAFFKAKVLINAPPIGATVPSSNLLHKLFPSPQHQKLLQDLERGLSGNITTEMDLQVADLANYVASDPKLSAILHSYLNGAISWQAVDLAQYPSFQRAWERFLAQFGSRTPGELDIAKPRWHDEPRSLLRMVIANSTPRENRFVNTHRTHFAELSAKNLAAQQALLLSLGNSFKGRIKRRIASRLMIVFSNCAPCRENPKFLMIQVMDVVRRHLLEAAQLMVNQGNLEKVDDVFFLRMEEILTYFSTNAAPLQLLVNQRKSDYAHYQNLTPPRVILSTGEILRQQLSAEGLPAGALAASAVSAGIVEGIAHVISDPAAEHLSPGEILVAPFTDPGWTPLFVNAAGLILETGGMMTHGSVVAREYGIPAVVGVVDATRILKSGMRVRINGDLGYVEILDQIPSPA